MVASLQNSCGPCSAAASAVTITSEREALGIKFSYPYYKSSLSTLVQASHSSGSGWGEALAGTGPLAAAARRPSSSVACHAAVPCRQLNMIVLQ